MIPLGEQILCNTIFEGYEILIDGMVLKANLILLEMYDFDIILGMDWLSTHRASVDCFTKKVVFQKPRFLELKFVGDRSILPTCVISALEAKRLLHKGCEAYLAHVVDTSTLKVTLRSVSIVQEFLDCFLRIYQDCHQIENWSLVLNYYRDQLLFLYHCIGWSQLS